MSFSAHDHTTTTLASSSLSFGSSSSSSNEHSGSGDNDEEAGHRHRDGVDVVFDPSGGKAGGRHRSRKHKSRRRTSQEGAILEYSHDVLCVGEPHVLSKIDAVTLEGHDKLRTKACSDDAVSAEPGTTVEQQSTASVFPSHHGVKRSSAAVTSAEDTSAPECTTQTQPCTSTHTKTDHRRNSTSVVSESRMENFLVEAVGAGVREEHGPSPSHSPSLRSPTPLDFTAPPKQRCRAVLSSRSTENNGAPASRPRAGSAGDAPPMHPSQQQGHTTASPPCAALDTTQEACAQNHRVRDGTDGGSVPQNARRLSFSGSAAERSRSQSDRCQAAPPSPPSCVNAPRDALHDDHLQQRRAPSPVCPAVQSMATPPLPPLSNSADPSSAPRLSTPPLPSFVHPEDTAVRASVAPPSSYHPTRSRPASPLLCPSPHKTSVFVDDSRKVTRTYTATPSSSPSATPPAPPLENTMSATVDGMEKDRNGSGDASSSPRLAAPAALRDDDGYRIPSTLHSSAGRGSSGDAVRETALRPPPPQQQPPPPVRDFSPVWSATHGLMRCTSSILFDERKSPLHDSVEDAGELSSAAPPRVLLPRTYLQPQAHASPFGHHRHSSHSVDRSCSPVFYHSSSTPPPQFSAPPVGHYPLTPPLPFLTPPPPRTAEGLCVPQLVPTHDSVFFPLGTAVIAPVMLHYATVGGWSTCAGGRDYFNHRRLRGGEVAGHTVRWLHTAHPRDRFVFVVTPVVNLDEENGRGQHQQQRQQHQQKREETPSAPNVSSGAAATPCAGPTQRPAHAQWWGSLRTMLFGEAPWFTVFRAACGPRSCIACDDAAAQAAAEEDEENDDAVMRFAVSGRSTSGVYDPCAYSFPTSASASRECYTVAGEESVEGGRVFSGGLGSKKENVSPPRRVARSVETSNLHAHPDITRDGSSAHYNASRSSRFEGEMHCSRTALPCCMSPMLVTRQPSHSSASVHATPVDAATSPFPTPLSIGLPLSATGVAATGHAGKSAHRLATPSAANGPIFPSQTAPGVPPDSSGVFASQPRDVHRRASDGGHRFVFSPLTGTAVSTSGVSPVTPHPPKVRSQRPQQQQQCQRTRESRSPTPSRPSEAAASSTSATTNVNVASAVPGDAVLGVEVIEIAHADVTAMDYAPRLTSHRLSIESKEVYTFFFPTLMDALTYYQCTEAMPLMEEQWAAGMSSQIPRPQRDGPRRQQQQQQQRASAEHRSSSVRTPSLAAHPARSPARAGDSASFLPPSWTPDSGASPVLRYPDHRSIQQPLQQPLLSRSASCPTPSLSLASALRSAGRGDCGDDGDDDQHNNNNNHRSCSSAERGGVAPTRLFRPGSLPSLDVEVYDPGSDAAYKPLTSPACFPPPSLSSPVAAAAVSGGGEGKCADVPPPPPSDSMPHLAPPTPASAAPPRRVVQPRLTSTHHEIVVSVYTADPVFNSVLRELLMPEPGSHPYTVSVAEQKRLLSMVEVGMPAWAVFYSSTGLPYRRLFRLLYSGLTNLWPLLSLAVGVYDLYKHLPQLKRFMERTLDPLTRWLERRFTLRFSVLATYLFSSVITIFSSLSAFVSQFYVVQLFSLPIVQLVFALLKLPFVLAFDTVWLVTSTAFSTISLVLQLVRVLVMAPVVFVVNIASLRETVGVVAPVAVQGTSLSVKWWKAWSEFWETVASPMKNAVRAWWDSMLHVSTSAAKRETSIRRWYSPKVEAYSTLLGQVQEMVAINAQLWWTDLLQPGLRRLVVLVVALVYLYWLFLGISDKVWDDFIYASGVRHPAAVTAAFDAAATAGAGAGGGAAGATTAAAGGGIEGHQQHTTAVEVHTRPDDEVTPVAAVLHVLFQAPFDLFASARNAIIASSSAVTTTATPAAFPLDAACAALTDDANVATRRGSAHPVLYPPGSVIQMCDSTGTATITTTTTHTTAGTPGAFGSATTLITTVTTTVFPLPQASLTALAAELLLPNAVLEVLHHVRQLLWGGWGVVREAASAAQQRRQQRQVTGEEGEGDERTGHATYVNTSHGDNSSDLPRCVCRGSSGGDAAEATRGGGVTAGDTDLCPREERAVAVVSDPQEDSPPPSASRTTSENKKSESMPTQMRRYVEERLSLVAVRRRHRVVVHLDVQPTWAEMTYLRRGNPNGRETPRETPVVPVEGHD